MVVARRYSSHQCDSASSDSRSPRGSALRWSDDDGPYDGTHDHWAETLWSPAPVNSPRPRILSGASEEHRTLRLVAADARNIFGDADTNARELAVLGRHCDDVGRDRDEIEVTTLIDVDESMAPNDIVNQARDLAAVGVQTIVANSSTAEPSKLLETTCEPVVPRLREIDAATFRHRRLTQGGSVRRTSSVREKHHHR